MKRSYRAALSGAFVLAWSYGLQNRERVAQRDVLRDILYGDEPEPVRRYFRLESYLRRRSVRGRAYVKDYAQREEVKQRRKDREATPEFRAKNAQRMRQARLRNKESD